MTTQSDPPAEGNPHRGASDHEGAGHNLDLTSGFERCDCIEAVAWRMLAESEHILDLLGEWSEWDRRRTDRQTSHDIAAARTWKRGLTYEELRRRRRLTSVHDCAVCGSAVEVEHPLTEEQFAALPRLDWVRCPLHAVAA